MTYALSGSLIMILTHSEISEYLSQMIKIYSYAVYDNDTCSVRKLNYDTHTQ